MISVIVPVYGVEEYLDRCVQSILNQSYKDYELILVDDGSPDRCPEICDKYAERYDHVRVIHKKNGGLSDARNAGVAQAKGDYVTFVDSDDYVAENYLQTLVGLKEKYQADMSVVGHQKFYKTVYLEKGKKETKEHAYSGMEALKNMLYQNTLDSHAWALLIPVSYAVGNPFPLGKYHEDELTTYKYYLSADCVAVSEEQLYFYFQRPNSIMHTFGKASKDELDAADNYVSFCELNYPGAVQAAKHKKFSDYCQVLLSVERMDYIDSMDLNRILEFLNQEKKGILLDKNARKKNRIAALLLYAGPWALFAANRVLRALHKFSMN